MIYYILLLNITTIVIMQTPYECEKYLTTPENLKKTVEKYGVAIIPGVLNITECRQTVSGIWDFFEHITQNWETPINRNKKESWKGFYKLYPMHSMLFQHWNIGHAQVVWNLRQKRKIAQIFSTLWNVPIEELLVSFDGLSFHPPPEETKRGKFRKTWFHTDQSYNRNDAECIQSWITPLDVKDGDATLLVYEGSNRYHKEFADTYPESKNAKSDWCKLTEEQEQFYIEKGCYPKAIKCPAGSMVFWDSRTIHCGRESLKNREKAKWRAVIYLCYMPRSQASEKQLQKKRKAFNELRMTSHWPTKTKLFAKNPRTYGAELPEICQIPSPTLTQLGKKLAGF